MPLTCAAAAAEGADALKRLEGCARPIDSHALCAQVTASLRSLSKAGRPSDRRRVSSCFFFMPVYVGCVLRVGRVRHDRSCVCVRGARSLRFIRAPVHLCANRPRAGPRAAAPDSAGTVAMVPANSL